MGEDFGYVERRKRRQGMDEGGQGSLGKTEHGKLTNGKNKSNLHPEDHHRHPHDDVDDCRDATSARTVEPDGLDQSMRKLSLSPDSSSTVSNGDGNCNFRSENQREKMLKHIRTTVKSTSGGGGSQNKSVSNVTSPEKSGGNKINGINVERIPAPSVEDETQLPLPQRFVVKYLGHRETSNLWGIKYTRRPVDEMVTEAKAMLASNSDQSLPLLKMEVTDSGIIIGPMPQNNNPDFPNGKFPIEAISYGVQDLVYTRVFAMIVVRSALISEDQQNQPDQEQRQSIRLADIQKAASGGGSTSGNNGDPPPFRCHAFVCDSRQTARKLTYSLAAAFHKFSKSVAAGKVALQKPKKFAIDLRSPEDIEADLLDSEA